MYSLDTGGWLSGSCRSVELPHREYGTHLPAAAYRAIGRAPVPATRANGRVFSTDDGTVEAVRGMLYRLPTLP